MPYSSSQFSYSKKDREFATESSSLDVKAGQRLPHFIQIQSDTTGKIADFSYVSTTRDDEGDVQFWTYEPTSPSVLQNPGLRNHTLVVFND